MGRRGRCNGAEPIAGRLLLVWLYQYSFRDTPAWHRRQQYACPPLVVLQPLLQTTYHLPLGRELLLVLTWPNFLERVHYSAVTGKCTRCEGSEIISWNSPRRK